MRLSHSHGFRTLQWRHNHQCLDCLNNQPVTEAQVRLNIRAPRRWPLWWEFTGEFPTERASNAENVSILLRHHEKATHNETYVKYGTACRNVLRSVRLVKTTLVAYPYINLKQGSISNMDIVSPGIGIPFTCIKMESYNRIFYIEKTPVYFFCIQKAALTYYGSLMSYVI